MSTLCFTIQLPGFDRAQLPAACMHNLKKRPRCDFLRKLFRCNRLHSSFGEFRYASYAGMIRTTENLAADERGLDG
jgi:hypothetical protein